MPRVNVTRDWKLLPASSGTIDNNGVVPVEISQDKEVGIVIHPKSRFSYMNVELYIKSHKRDTIVSLVEFAESGQSGAGNIPDEKIATDDDIDKMFD